MNRNDAIQSQFGAAAARYATSRYHQLAPDLDAMLDLVEPRGDERVLDVGTGTGHTALAFAPRVREVVGLDLTEAMLEQARRLAGEQDVDNVRFHQGDAIDMPYADGHFDLVTCRVCAHHFADPRRVVAEMARVLRPGGTLVLVDSVSSEDPAEDSYLNCIELIRDPSHVRNYSVSQWQTTLEEAGFAAEWITTWPVPLDFEDWVTRMGTPELECAQLRSLFERAPSAIRSGLGIRAEEPYGFDIPIAMFRAVKR